MSHRLRTLPRLAYEWMLDHVNIRLRLALWYALLLAATLSLLGVIVYAVASYQIETSVDQSLQSNAQVIAQTVQGAAQPATSQVPAPTSSPPASATASPAGPSATAGPDATATPATSASPSPAPTATPITIPPDTQKAIKKRLELSPAVTDLLGHLNMTFEVLDARTQVLYVPTNLEHSPLPPDNAALRAALQTGACTAYDRRQGGSELRVYVYPIIARVAGQTGRGELLISGPTTCAKAPGTAPIGVVVVVKAIDDVNTSLSTLRRLLVAGVIVAVLLSSAGAWLIAGSSLRPLSNLTRTARAIAKTAKGGGLGRRVGYRGPRDEVGELASTFDDMLAALERTAIAQRRFIADASHELRAPLTTIKGSLELLTRVPDMPAEERAAVVSDAYDEAERMTGLVNDLLLLARADAASAGGKAQDDQMRGRRELIELDQLTFEVFRHGRAQLLARPNAHVQLSIGNLEPLVTEGDPGQLRQLLLILLDNALKYTPSGGRVRLSMSQEDGRAAISVTDTGIGIEPEILPHIFERFFRGDLARERDEHGSGLGLAIAQWIVNAHGGDIRVESAPGAGSTFTVLLPAVRRPGEQTSAKHPAMSLPPASKKRPRFSVAGVVTAPLTRLANASRPQRMRDAREHREHREKLLREKERAHGVRRTNPPARRMGADGAAPGRMQAPDGDGRAR